MSVSNSFYIEDATAPELKSYELESYDIVLSNSDINIDASAVIEDDFSGLNGASFTWQSPSGNQYLHGGHAYEYVLTEGDINNGTYEFETNELSRYAESGEWTLQSAYLGDKAQNSVHLHTEQLQELGIRTDLTITNNKSDATAPELKSYELESYDIVLSNSDVNIDASAVIEDDFSGLNGASFTWQSPSGNQYLHGGHAYEYVLTEGDINNGTYEFETNELSRYAESGEWTLQSAYLGDKAQNSVHLHTEQLQELGIRTDLTITNNKSDATAPELKSYELESYDIVLSNSDVNIDASAVIEDDFSGLNGASFTWQSPSGNQYLHGGHAYEYVLTEGDINNGTYEFETNELSRYAESGEWTLQSAYLGDKAQNSVHLNTEQLQELGIRTDLNIAGASGYLGPSAGPRAKNFDSGLLLQEGDIQSGLNFGYIYSELVKVKDYEPSGDYPGYTFSAKDFEAIEVHYDFGSDDSNASLEEGGITVDETGNITINTNSAIYQELYQGDKEEIHVAFSVTDDNNRSDNGLVTFEVLGAGPQAKDFYSGLVVEEDTIQPGLNFGYIYSELVKTKGYEASEEDPGYTFTAKDFEALEVILGSDAPVSLHKGGITVDENGNITIDTNASVYQKLNDGDQEQASVIFKVTDNNNYSDIGSVLFDVTGKDESTGPASLGLSYELYNSDGSALTQLSVLGDDVNYTSNFVLNLKAESLEADQKLESTDLTIKFNPNLFNTIDASDITIGGSLPIANAVQIDNALGTIRIAAASLSDLGEGNPHGPSALASISLDFDEDQIKTLAKNDDGSLKINPLAFEISANDQETIFSKSLYDGTGFNNREISSLASLGGFISVEGQDVTLYEAKVNLAQQGDGLVLGTQRVIGSDASITNLVRSGDTLTTSAEWLNVGNIQANNLSYEAIVNQNALLVSADFSRGNIASGSFIDGVFVQDARESTVLTTDIKITGEAGNVVDLGDGIVSVKADAEGSAFFSNAGKGSSNLITFQGDLNYDGRVSMKDLAYLNAGAARQQLIESTDENGIAVQVASEASYARDVDADFSGKIDLVDLSILDADWGKTLHTGDEQFQGSDDVSWSELDNYGAMAWKNDSFKDQNAIEAQDSYVGSLESPTAAGVIGADGNTTANDNDITGTEFQDPFPA